MTATDDLVSDDDKDAAELLRQISTGGRAKRAPVVWLDIVDFPGYKIGSNGWVISLKRDNWTDYRRGYKLKIVTNNGSDAVILIRDKKAHKRSYRKLLFEYFGKAVADKYAPGNRPRDY
jgi:hypothetical protein